MYVMNVGHLIAVGSQKYIMISSMKGDTQPMPHSTRRYPVGQMQFEQIFLK